MEAPQWKTIQGYAEDKVHWLQVGLVVLISDGTGILDTFIYCYFVVAHRKVVFLKFAAFRHWPFLFAPH